MGRRATQAEDGQLLRGLGGSPQAHKHRGRTVA